jgi:hypothetical protein
MKPATLALCLLAGLMASGCIIVHETTREKESERHDDSAFVVTADPSKES